MGLNTTLKFSEIIFDDSLQPPDRYSEDHEETIAEAYKKRAKIKRPLVMKISDREGKYYAIDWHRIRAQGAIQKTVHCTVLSGTWEDALDMATASNTEHNALPRRRKDKEWAIRKCLELHPDWTDGRTAKHTNTSHTLVSQIRKTMPKAAAVTSRIGVDNKVRDVRDYHTATKNGTAEGGRGKRGESEERRAESKTRHLFDWQLFEGTHFGWLKRATDTLAELALAASMPKGKEGEEPDKEKVSRAQKIVNDEKKKMHAALSGYYKQYLKWKARVTAKE